MVTQVRNNFLSQSSSYFFSFLLRYIMSLYYEALPITNRRYGRLTICVTPSRGARSHASWRSLVNCPLPDYPPLMRHTNLRLACLLCWLLSLNLLSSPATMPVFAAELRAGVAKIDITPNQPVMLAGYASRKELSQGVHDPLFARAVAFDENHQRFLLVAIDNCGFYNAT